MTKAAPTEPQVIAPNLKRRLSGVTATVHSLVPLQAREIAIVAVGPALPAHVPQISFGALLRLSARPTRVWHARRNIEMIAGLALRHLARKRLRLLFTSASQRDHTWLSRWLIGRMDAVVAVSDKSAAYLKVPHRVIRHGIDTKAFHPAPDKSELRARLGLPPDGLLVGCFGRIRAQKGTGDFVDAMARILPDRPDVHAIAMGGVVGHEAYAKSLADQITAAGLEERIRLLPEVPVEAMGDWYAALDLYVAPQRWEGFGLTVLEAMASGTPVVATRVGAFEELVAEGETGCLIPPGDVSQMARAVAELLDDPPRLEAMRDAARTHVVTHFPIEGEAAALVALYCEMLAAA